MSHNETREHLRAAIHEQLDTLELPNINHSLVREWIDIALAETADGSPAPIKHRIAEADHEVTEPTDAMGVHDLIDRRKAAKLGKALLLDVFSHDATIPHSVIDEAA
jgi:hypothetical protein